MDDTEPLWGGLTINEVAELTGLSAHTLRYYERIGLLDEVARGIGGQRRYGRADLEWIAFLQRLRSTGMTIRDMQRFAELRRGGDDTVADRRRLLETHRDELVERIEELQRDLHALTEKITHYKESETRHDHDHTAG